MIKKSKTSKIVAGAVGIALALAMVVGVAAPTAQAAALTSAQVSAIISLLQSFGADANTIANVQASLTGQPTTTTTGTTGTMMTSGYQFSTPLYMGVTSPAVAQLQMILNSNSATQVAATGTGSSGMESDYFGALTKAAVIKFQNLHGIVPASGYVGSITEGVLNSMTTNTTTTTTTTTTTGTTGTTGTTVTPGAAGTLTVSAAAEPANSLAPQGASRVPFTTVTLTAGATAVTVSGINIQRIGLGSDAVFSGIVLLDSNGNQIGNSQTFNSNHQATVGTTWTIPAGTSQTLTIAGNMQSSLSAYAGQVVGIEVTGINTSATVQGAVLTAPITGAMQTINATVALGSATIAVSSFDPNGSTNQNIGTTAYRFAGVKITAGSAENVILKSIRWNQTGSAGSADLSNLATYVNGVAYPVTVDTTGKYFTSNFGTGIVINEGFSVDAYVQGDLTGSNSAGRTAEFDLYKNTDVYLLGQTYGYGIIPVPSGNTASTATTGSEFLTSDGTASGSPLTPFFSGSLINITAGTLTTIQKAVSVPAQNISINVPNQPLGGFTTTFQGEPVNVQSLAFHFTASGPLNSATINNITLVDQNGNVVAGPYNATLVAANGSTQTVTFSSQVTFPVGTDTYTLKGTIPAGVTGGTTLSASTTPSSDWTNVVGATTGNTISLSGSGVVTMNTMTIQGISLTVAINSSVGSTNIVPGGSQTTFDTIQLDASQSSDDVRLGSIPLQLALTAGGTNNAATNLSGCQLWNGSTPVLNTAVNPSNGTFSSGTASSAGSVSTDTFTFQNPLVVPRGTVVALTLTCSVSSSASGGYQWGIVSSPAGVTGNTSGGNVTVTVPSSNTGPVLTATSGALAITTDPTSPSYNLVSAGSSGVVVGAYQFQATNEPVNLTRIGFQLTNMASSTAGDVADVTLWNGSCELGTATFTGVTATTTLYIPGSAPSGCSAGFATVPSNGTLTLTVKADLNPIINGGSALPGHLLAVNVYTLGSNDNKNTQGSGVSSGITYNATGSTSVAGVRIFQTVPQVALGTLSTSGITGDGKLIAFSITNPTNDPNLQLNKFAFTFATSSGINAITGVNLYDYTDSGYSLPASDAISNGQLLASNVANAGSNSTLSVTVGNANGYVTVPAGQTRYFLLKGTVTLTGSNTNNSVATTLLGDSSYPALATFRGAVSSLGGSNFIWSDGATSTAAATTANAWVNGYNLANFPSSGLTESRTQ
jgi:hypothetical protein